ncbi:MAG: M16 family metallopeptidase, partial [Mariprofundaceae bacterium]
VLLMQAHNVPMVSMQLTTVSGSRFDPGQRGGTAALLAQMLTDHTAKHDHKAWAQYLDIDAIQLGGSVTQDSLSLSVTVLKEALGEGVAALSEAVLHPGWNKKRFNILKEDAVSAAQKARENPGHIASETTIQLLFGAHPYGHLSQGSVQSLSKVKLANLKALYKEQVRPQEAVLAVSGDVAMQELIALIQPALKEWKGHGKQALFDIQAAKHRPSFTSVSMASQQTHLAFARLGSARKDADLFPLLILNHIFGGSGFASILMQEVREKRGLVYGIYSYFSPLATSGPYIIKLQTKASQKEEAAHIVQSQLLKLSSTGVNRKQLKAAKSNLVGSFAQRMDSNRERMGLISMIGFYDLPLNYLQVWTDKIKSIRLEQVNNVARKYYPPEQWSLIQVGPRVEPASKSDVSTE